MSLIIAHLLADFYLQTDHMVQDKLRNLKKHILHHLLVNTAVLTAGWLLFYQENDPVTSVVWPVLFITGTHLIIDLVKIKLVDQFTVRENLNKLWFFVLDQLLHLFMLLIALQLFYQKSLVSNVDRFIQLLFEEGRQLGASSTILVIVIILILGTTVSGHIIRILLGSLPGQLLTFEGKYTFKNELKETAYPQASNGQRGLSEQYSYMIFNKHDMSRGKLIGYIERLLVILLTYYSSYPAIAFIVTAKSIARFKQMDDRDWAEYFLLGTLTSMFIGIMFGILLREILN
ncbi:DUF3307 domain-containing protein [Mesobacillus selenatarsenatis]|uniref:DUF3307 domain-containing protein n=1 Tax=Mesobacillus selenatarsenatis (strain DSM 18680 / JCM 14380 / FERM P-15431 / SF-1) TaxID=1321606 RepID=A0A0A8X4R4_MESS1|nr:DUF3307 domain-containing protein [Mesobacillus selenatarsenatis]GAM14032.1 hypothetical protein SAMD00020551_2179 [Mesobacillus selenatarsenatis SF-1]